MQRERLLSYGRWLHDLPVFVLCIHLSALLQVAGAPLLQRKSPLTCGRLLHDISVFCVWHFSDVVQWYWTQVAGSPLMQRKYPLPCGRSCLHDILVLRVRFQRGCRLRHLLVLLVLRIHLYLGSHLCHLFCSNLCRGEQQNCVVQEKVRRDCYSSGLLLEVELKPPGHCPVADCARWPCCSGQGSGSVYSCCQPCWAEM